MSAKPSSYAQGKSARPVPAHHRRRGRTARHHHHSSHRLGRFQKAPRRNGKGVGRVAAKKCLNHKDTKAQSRIQISSVFVPLWLIHFAFRRWLFYASAMPSFDIVSQVNSMEIENAVNQAKKELANRFDFKSSKWEIVLEKTEIKLTADRRVQSHARSMKSSSASSPSAASA